MNYQNNGEGFPPQGFSGPPAPPAGKRKIRAPEAALIAISLAILVMLAILVFVLSAMTGSISALFSSTRRANNPPSGTFSVITVNGTLASVSSDSLGIDDPSYHHSATVDYIKKLADDEGNAGILLRMNTSGGGVYESDELYRALESYKEKTGRPVWAYMASVCASGGYYVCMAADYVVANYNTTTGSIGVYIALTDLSGLYDKLGIETVLIRSGENKGVGTAGVEITEEQRAVFQSEVDEYYERFVSLVVLGRGMEEEEAKKLSDGRSYTANQALENGLVDELTDWDTVVTLFEEETAATAFYTDFSNQTLLGRVLSGIKSALPRGETETMLALAEQLPTGVPLAWAPGLAA